MLEVRRGSNHKVKLDLKGVVFKRKLEGLEVDPSVKPALIRSYAQWSSHMQEVLLIESSYVRGNISADEVSQRYEELKTKFSLQ